MADTTAATSASELSSSSISLSLTSLTSTMLFNATNFTLTMQAAMHSDPRMAGIPLPPSEGTNESDHRHHHHHHDHSHDNNHRFGWLDTYPTTLMLLGILHIVYVWHWNSKRSKKQLLVTFQQLVPQRQYYRGITALLSHPPVESFTNQQRQDHSNMTAMSTAANAAHTTAASSLSRSIEMGHATSTVDATVARTPMQAFQQLYIKPLWQGHLSGLPLLLYNAHILWSCRALEPSLENEHFGTFGSDSTADIDNNNNNDNNDMGNSDTDGLPVYYMYCLLSWAVLPILMEIRWSHNMLTVIRQHSQSLNVMSFQSIQPDFLDSSSQLPNTRRILLHRSMGSCTGLCATVLWVYHSQFAYTSMEPLPFVPYLSTLLSPFLSYTLSVLVLTALSWRIHAVTPVLCGTLAGMLWSVGLTRFLATLYWGRLLLLWTMGFCLISMTYRCTIPCIDYVSWDARGRMKRQQDTGRSVDNAVVNGNNETLTEDNQYLDNDLYDNDDGDDEYEDHGNFDDPDHDGNGNGLDGLEWDDNNSIVQSPTQQQQQQQVFDDLEDPQRRSLSHRGITRPRRRAPS